jgi:hypothetical protein
MKLCTGFNCVLLFWIATRCHNQGDYNINVHHRDNIILYTESTGSGQILIKGFYEPMGCIKRDIS